MTPEMREMRKSQFLNKTSMFLKRVTLVKAGRRKSEDKRSSMTATPRGTRSLDLGSMGHKPFGMSQPVLSVNPERSMADIEDHSDGTGSPSQHDSRPASSIQATPLVNGNASQNPAGDSASSRQAAQSHGSPGLPATAPMSVQVAIDGLPPSEPCTNPFRASYVPFGDNSGPVLGVATSDSTVTEVTESASRGSSDTFHSAHEDISSEPFPESSKVEQPPPAPAAVVFTPQVTFNVPTPVREPAVVDTNTLQACSQSLPSRSIIVDGINTPTSNVPTPTPASPQFTTPADGSTPKPIHPRLASLPPPMMARYAAQGSARLTPSIVPRPTPILTLPTLPPPTPVPQPTPAQISSPARLRSMPALPMRGPSEIDTGADADHETAALDEMDEEDEDEDSTPEHVEQPSEDEEDSQSSPSVEVPSMGRRLRSPLPPSLSRSPREPALPNIDTSRFDVSFPISASPTAGPSEPNRATTYFTPNEPPDVLHTPVAAFRKAPVGGSPNVDYFTSRTAEKQPARDPVRTPRPADFVEAAFIPKTVPMPHSSPRPGLYQQGSRSMVDLLSISRKQDKQREMEVGEKRQSRVPDYTMATTRDTPEGSGPSAQSGTTAPPLRRQRSLPMYNPATEPPPYPAFGPHGRPTFIQPREEEGKEQLPPYTNSIYLAAIMPRKMEFTAPGFQARDRKWKRALCILEGTMFKIYRVHNGVVEDWWERTVGVGDKTSIDPVAVGPSGGIRVSAIREAERARADPVKPGDETQSDSTSPSQNETGSSASASGPSMSHSRSKFSSLLHPRHRHDKPHMPGRTSSRSRISFDTGRGDDSTSRRQSMDSARSGPSPTASSSALSSSRRGRQSSEDTSATSATSATSMSGGSPSGQCNSPTPAVRHFTSLSSCDHEPIPEPDFRDLVRKYTLQHAESGLASDYTKRKNVIRVRMEGEQFLLQAQDVPAVIEWIEGIQAATNIALDLDERPMPKGPMFPRRRRRRPRRPEGEAQGQAGAASRTGASS